MELENAKKCLLALPICCGNTLPLTHTTKQHFCLFSSSGCTGLLQNKKVLDLLLQIDYLCLANLLHKHSVLCCQDPVSICEYRWSSCRLSYNSFLRLWDLAESISHSFPVLMIRHTSYKILTLSSVQLCT